MSDKRSVATDALETLGTIIDDKQKRDAIHIAVEPVVAGERMMPGDHITVIDGVAFRADPDDENAPLGIVDPFLKAPVRKGQRFWFLMYPRMVRSLRHVWAHEAFPDELVTAAKVGAKPFPTIKQSTIDELADLARVQTKAASEKWLRDFCAGADCPSYETVIAKVADDSPGWDEECLHFNDKDAHGEIPDEFWVHAEIVLGRKLKHHPTSFSCSC